MNTNQNQWAENRFTKFQIGLLLSLLFVLLAFNYESDYIPYEMEEGSFEEMEIDEVVEVNFLRSNKTKSIKLEPIADLSNEISLFEQEVPVPDFHEEAIESDIYETSKKRPGPALKLPLPQPDFQLPEEIVPEEKIYTFAEQMPLYQECQSKYDNYQEQLDCTTKRLMSLIQKELRYPAIARENNIESTVFVSFEIGVDGVIRNTKIEKSAVNIFDQPVIDALSKLPEMIPAEQNHSRVAVKMYMPIKFRLSQ